MRDFQLLEKIKKKSNEILTAVWIRVKNITREVQKDTKQILHFFGLFLIPLILCITAIIFWLISQVLFWQVQALQIQDNPFPDFSASEYPVIERQYIPEISAQAAYIVDTNSFVPIFTKNETIRFSPASTTKIMTSLTALDYYKLDDVLTVQRDFVEGSGLHFVKGEKLTFKSLLYAMMLPSANDAAYAIADNFPGGMGGFVAKMNEKAASLYLTNTHFQDSAGLEDDGDFTTAHDLAILAAVAMHNPTFAQIVNTKSYTISSFEGQVYKLKNLNDLLGLYGVIGVKTGYTPEAGEVLVTASRHNGHVFVSVVMKSEDRFGDTEKLLQFLSNNVTFVAIKP